MQENDAFITVAVGLWFVIFGSCLGSFLNVAVYRLPNGKSLLHPPSHCPRCGHPIRWFDNVPVFGWLFLRGKCRDCRLPISVRYPAIEALCGLLSGGGFCLFICFTQGQPLWMPVIGTLLAESTAIGLFLFLLKRFFSPPPFP